MATVDEYIDEYFQRNVAYKKLKRDSKLVQRTKEFVREAKIMAKLEHPGIVPIHALLMEDSDVPSITMGKVLGGSLSLKIEKCKKGIEEWPLAERIEIFSKLVEVLSYAHDKKIIHRDIKPSNVMLGEYGAVFLLDWGLAKSLQSSDQKDNVNKFSEDGTQSMAGAIKGTPYYMSPEAARGKSDLIDEQSDIVSLGAVLYEMLTLNYLIKGEKALDVLRNAAESNYNRTSLEGVPDELVYILEKCIDPIRQTRYQKADHLLKDIYCYQNNLPIQGMDQLSIIYRTKKWFERNWVRILLCIVPILFLIFYIDYFVAERKSIQKNIIEILQKTKEININKGTLIKRHESINKDIDLLNKNIESHLNKIKELSQEVEKERYDLNDEDEEPIYHSTLDELQDKIKERNGVLDELSFKKSEVKLNLKSKRDVYDKKIQDVQQQIFLKNSSRYGMVLQTAEYLFSNGKYIQAYHFIQNADLEYEPFASHVLKNKIKSRYKTLNLEHKFLNQENVLIPMDQSIEDKYTALFPRLKFIKMLKLNEEIVLYTREGRVFQIDSLAENLIQCVSHVKIPMKIIAIPQGLLGMYDGNTVFFQRNIYESPEVIFHDNQVLKIDKEPKSIIIKDKNSTFEYLDEIPLFSKSNFYLDSIYDQQDEIPDIYSQLPMGYRPVAADGNRLLLVSYSFGKTRYREFDIMTENTEYKWNINKEKFETALTFGTGWIIQTKSGQVYQLLNSGLTKYMFGKGEKVSKMFSLEKLNLLFFQMENRDLYFAYLNTGQILFSIGKVDKLEKIGYKEIDHSIIFETFNGEALQLKLD